MFHIENNHILPTKGNILISEPFLDDKYFGRSVVLLVEHDENLGSMGFVLNKPMKTRLNDFFPELKSIPDIPLFQGGPVGTDKLYFIHTLGDMIPYSTAIGDELFFDGDFNCIKSYISEGNSVEGKIKFFLGYSGWSQKQLNDEISCNSWLVSKFDESRMMKHEGEICWKRALQSLGDKYKSWANFPKRPFLN